MAKNNQAWSALATIGTIVFGALSFWLGWKNYKLQETKIELENANVQLGHQLSLMRAAGTFSGPRGVGTNLVDSLISTLETMCKACEDPIIITDMPAYGSFTYHEEFKSYKRSIEEMARSAKRSGQQLRAVFLSDKAADEVRNRQFAQWGEKIRDESFQTKARAWFADVDIMHAIETRSPESSERLKALAAGDLSDLDQSFFLACLRGYNRSVIDDLKRAGAWVKRYDDRLPMHFWFSGKMGIVSIESFEAVVDEPGFSITDATCANSMLWVAQSIFDRARPDEAASLDEARRRRLGRFEPTAGSSAMIRETASALPVASETPKDDVAFP